MHVGEWNDGHQPSELAHPPLQQSQPRRCALASSGSGLLAELQGVLSRDKFAAQLIKRGLTVKTVFGGYVALVHCVSPLTTPRVIERDPDDKLNNRPRKVLGFKTPTEVLFSSLDRRTS